METKQKTLAECKDEVARNKGYLNWSDYLDKCYVYEERNDIVKFQLAFGEAAELYAGQTKESSPVNLEVEEAAEKANGYSVYAKGSEKYHAFNEGFIAGAKWQSQQPASVAWLSDDTVSLRMEFENEVKVNKDGISVLFETSNQHYIEWLEKRIKLQQHVSIQWFTDDEIFERCPIAYCNQAHIEAKRLGAIWLQSELRKRVIDPVDLLNWIFDNARKGYEKDIWFMDIDGEPVQHSTQELLQIYINSKTK